LYKSGYQRPILAIETFIKKTLKKRIGLKWDGFVISVDRKFFARDEILNVPHNVYFTPKDWWPIYHEIGHMILDNYKVNKDKVTFSMPSQHFGITDRDVPAIRHFLSNKIDDNKWLNLIDEICAEIIGYELGFYSDYTEFFRKTWNYISSIEIYEKNFEFEDYIVRTFCVEMYHKIKYKKATVNDLSNIDELYVFLKEHIKKIESTINQEMKRSVFFAARSVKSISEIIPIINYLHELFSNIFKFPPTKEKYNSKTNNIVSKLKSGEVYFGPIESPEVILYKLMKVKTCEDKTSIAFILSLWNQEG
jgi:hypothetical protein